MHQRRRFFSRSWIGGGAVLASLVAVGACNAIAGLDDLQHVVPSGGTCVDPLTDCPTGISCGVYTCQDGVCTLGSAPAGAPCGDAGSLVCSATGECVECIEDKDCAAPLSCGGGGTPGACGCEAPCHVWSQLFHRPEEKINESFASAIAVDPTSKAAVVTGWFGGSLQIDKNTLTSVGGQDAFLAKLDANGGGVWSKRFGDNTDQIGLGVAVGGDGSVLMTGGFNGTVDFGAGSITSKGLRDVFIAKFTAGGDIVWNKFDGGKNSETDDQFGIRIAVDSNGNSYTTGAFAGALNLGDAKISAGLADVFLTKLSPAGDHLWTKVFGGPGDDRGLGVAVDAVGNVVVTGVFGGTVDFGGGPVSNADGQGADIFIVKLSPNGTYLWSEQLGNNVDQYAHSISVDGDGSVLLAADLDGEVLKVPGGRDALVLKLDKDGKSVWARRFGGDKPVNALAAVDDGLGGVFVTGQFAGSVDFGGGALPSLNASERAFFLKLDAKTGAHVWSRAYGPTGVTNSRGLALDGDGNGILFGFTDTDIDFGGGALMSDMGSSMFLAKFKL